MLNESYNNVIKLNSFLKTIVKKTGNTSLDYIGNKLQKNMNNCKTHHITRMCCDCETYKPIPITCQIRICEKCEATRKYKINNRIFQYFKLFQHPKLLTLTFAEHEYPTHDVKRKCELFCREFRRRMLEAGYVFNGFRFLECVPKDDGFHIHFHYIIETRRFIPQKLISKVWLEVTGNSFIVDIRPISSKKGLEYALKYSSKPIQTEKFKKLGLTQQDIMKIYVQFFYKTRMWSKLGIFYNMKLQELKKRMVCSNCGSENYIILFYYQEPITLKEWSAFDLNKTDWGGKRWK